MKKLILILLVVLTSACASGHRDLSKSLTNSDKLEPSPCACDPIDYEHPHFEWIG